MMKDTIAFLGPLGTYSHQNRALKQFAKITARYFGSNVAFLPVPKIQSVFESVTASAAKYGIVPIENSNFGPVLETINLLKTTTLSVRDMTSLKIGHALLGKKGRIVKRVYSHCQGLGQCKNYLALHYPGIEHVECDSTSSAAIQSKADESGISICSVLCASVYDLDIIDTEIQDDGAANTTRFIILSLSSCNLDSQYPAL